MLFPVCRLEWRIEIVRFHMKINLFVYSPFRKFGCVLYIGDRTIVFAYEIQTIFVKNRVDDSTFPFVREKASRQ